MKTLPAKGVARAVSVVAMGGCALSLSVLTLALLGFHSKTLLNFQIALFVGVFPVFFLAVLAQERLLSEFSFRDRVRMNNPEFGLKVIRKVLVAHAPKWLWVTSIALLVNALAQFAVFAYATFPAKSASKADELRLFSAYAAAFYSAAAMILLSYAGTELPMRPDEL